jgi:hypothetical protein
MALLLPDNKYVKFNLDGSYVIYQSVENRLVNKESTTFDAVLKKYAAILEKMFSNQERRYYDPEFPKEVQAWVDEASKYKACVYDGNTSEDFPLIKKYIKDVKNTIPVIIGRGQFYTTASTLEELYEEMKHREIFGKIDEVKDI